MAKQRGMKWLSILCRVVLGVVFVFSGLMKLNDMWGSVNIVADYLSLVGLDVAWLNVAFAIGWSALELTLGVMLLTWVWRRLVAWSVMFIMLGFTILTLFIAIYQPLDDCGCFGEAVRMSDWFSFCKNVVLLVASFWLWKRIKGIEKVNSNWFGATIGMISLACGVSIGVFSYTNLPLVDLFPFKIDTNLRTDVVCTACMDEATTLIYKNLETGKVEEFPLSDTTWYDSTKWEYVETRTISDSLTAEDYDNDFAIYDSAGQNIAPQIINYTGITTITILGSEVFVSNEEFVDSEAIYRMPDKMREKLLRADRGVVTINDGIITHKEAL